MKYPSLLGRAGRSPAGVWLRKRLVFQGSARYWEGRYAGGGNSGAGSYGAHARWKADVVNAWVRELDIRTVVDLGCGDGNQLGLAEYPYYLGLDRSATAVRTCIERFRDDRTKSFLRFDPETIADPAGWLRAQLAISQEVIFHLVEDEVFEAHLRMLFDMADRYVIICSTDEHLPTRNTHERHRPFTGWVGEHIAGWELAERREPPAELGFLSSFFLYARTDGTGR